MNLTEGFFQRNEKWVLLCFLLLSYPLYFHLVGARDIWSPDEDEYFLVNREMVRDGHWVYPTANGQPYSIKPPLFNWIGSGLSLLAGEVTELTCRLPSAVAATLGLFVLYFLGRLLFGYRAAVFATLVLATSPLYIEFGRWIQINMISTVLLTATLLCFYQGYTDERRRTRAYLLMYAATGLGTLNMGLVNVAMPALVIGVYLIVVKDLKHIFEMRLVRGVLLYLAVVAPWYAVVSLRPGYAENLLIVTNFTRFFKKWTHTRPFYYYFGTTPPYFLPWFAWLPGAFWACFSSRTREDRKRLLFPFVWAVGLFLFFSLSKTKRSEYLLPIFPALALLVGYVLDRGFDRWTESVIWRRLVAWPAGLVLAALGLAGPGVAIFAATRSSDWFLIVLPVALFLVVAAPAIHLRLLRRGKGVEAVLAIGVLLTAAVAYAVGPVVAKRNERKSPRALCLEVKRFLRPGERLKTYRFYKPVFAVYTGRFVDSAENPEALARWFRAEAPVYVLAKEKEYLRLKDDFPLPIHVILRRFVDHRYILLLSNRPVSDRDTTRPGPATERSPR
jgi:4-amino-4-deoxy-L-arabinose transferase-like glycosyltransferase